MLFFKRKPENDKSYKENTFIQGKNKLYKITFDYNITPLPLQLIRIKNSYIQVIKN